MNSICYNRHVHPKSAVISTVYHCGGWWRVCCCVQPQHVVPLLATVREGGPHCDLLKVYAFLMHGGIWHIQTQHHSVSQCSHLRLRIHTKFSVFSNTSLLCLHSIVCVCAVYPVLTVLCMVSSCTALMSCRCHHPNVLVLVASNVRHVPL